MDRSSEFQNKQTQPLQNTTNRDGQPPGKRVCPLASAFAGTPNQWTDDTRSLLYARLRIAAGILFIGFSAFFVREVIFDVSVDQERPPLLTELLGVVTLLTGLVGGLLWSRWCPTLRQLRIVELAVFGIPALFFMWTNFCFACWSSRQGHDGFLDAYFSQSSIAWILLINLYGMYIPNSWKRAATVTGVLVLLPISVTLAAAIQYDTMRDEVAFEGGFSAMVLWLLISYLAAVYGAHKIGSLRRQAAAARQVGAYELKRLLGRGGMGEVHLAEHKFLKRPCAIKLIRPESAGDPSAVARFESEVQATARLTHWNTVEIYDYGHTDDGRFYYAMEYLPGMNLQDLVEEYGPLSPARAVYLLRQVCGALREAHQNDLIHRDIKPGNIFAAQRGGYYDVAKLLDFGLVKSTATPNRDAMKLTLEGMVIGSPLYTAPEIVMGDTKATPHTDIYSLGAVAYFLVTGKPVFDLETPLKVVFAHVHEEVAPPSELNPMIPRDLESVIMRCLAKRPEDRYVDVEELEAAFRDCECAEHWSPAAAEKWWLQRVDRRPLTVTAATQADVTTTVLPLHS